MHELGLTEEVVAIALERSGGARIKRIVVEVGKLSAVLPEAMLFCFDAVTHDTAAEGATLDIVEVHGTARCRQCNAKFPISSPLDRCYCGSMDLDWIGGDELKITQLELV